MKISASRNRSLDVADSSADEDAAVEQGSGVPLPRRRDGGRKEMPSARRGLEFFDAGQGNILFAVTAADGENIPTFFGRGSDHERRPDAAFARALSVLVFVILLKMKRCGATARS
ncbi:MAG TPA: hypothetical protein VGF73_07675 [Chthoniobacterales bacterium]